MNQALANLKALNSKARMAAAIQSIMEAGETCGNLSAALQDAKAGMWESVVLAHASGVSFDAMEKTEEKLKAITAYRSAKSVVIAAIGAAVSLFDDTGEIIGKNAVNLAIAAKEAGVSLTTKNGDKKTQKVLSEEIKAAKSAAGSLEAANSDTGNAGESVKLTPQQTIALGLSLLAQADDTLLLSFKKEIAGIVGRLDSIAKAKRAAMKKAA
jgi:hypothetical protein